MTKHNDSFYEKPFSYIKNRTIGLDISNMLHFPEHRMGIY